MPLALPSLSASVSPLAVSPLVTSATADSIVGWLWTLLLFLFLGLVAAGLCVPFLAVERVRSLFRALPPAGRTLPSFVAVSVALSTPYLAGVVLTVALVDSAGPGWREGLLLTALFAGFAPIILAPAVAVIGLPRLGIDWDPTGYGPSTWAILLAGGLWYAFLAAVPLVALAVGMALPGGY
ncbi:MULTISPECIES: hypothetical protein [Halorubrum]|uniref:DUF8162 domain-containing protein n=1 Tax=Halorubrum hochstenium ATCC 700873 TaxID=1227481 RepID=M0FF64_9EURY|nr:MULTISPECIES: hypothetical protein [Halorubrum]ELZ57264.1 hypothetical protein C467_06923 [Halorubrum hochstenium ATCC 700873]